MMINHYYFFEFFKLFIMIIHKIFIEYNSNLFYILNFLTKKYIIEVVKLSYKKKIIKIGLFFIF